MTTRRAYRPLLPYLSLTVAIGLLTLPSAIGHRRPADRVPVPKSAIHLLEAPLAFEPNAGQVDGSVAFTARALGGTVFFRAKDIVLSLPAPSERPRWLPRERVRPVVTGRPMTVQLRFLDISSTAHLAGAQQQVGKVNYLLGADAAHWRLDIPTYAGLRYEGLYPGIDLGYEGLAGRLKATYHVAAGADPTRIRWQYSDAHAVRVDPSTGDLHITLDTPRPVTLIEQAPVAWQEVGGKRVPVDARYATAADGSIHFALGYYDRLRALTIDPTLTYASYLGGNSADYAYDIAVDTQGNFYVTGATASTNFPLLNPVQATPSAYGDLFVSKFNANGTLVYSTYLGGNDSDVGFGIAVDGGGNAYVTGESWSSNFPRVNPIQSVDPGIQQDVIAFKLGPAGNSLIYSTYLGGHNSQTGWDIAVDPAGNAYISGHTLSSTFPVVNAVQPTIKGIRDAFVTKINAAGSALVYSTFLGSNGDLDYGFSIAVDTAGSAYVTGQTYLEGFPTVNAIQPTSRGFGEAFVSKFNPGGTALVYSTYLGGGDNESGRSIAVDGAGNAYLTGPTASTNFPTRNAIQPVKSGYEDAFVTKINAAGSALVYSTYLGGSSPDGNYDSNIAVDGAGNAYVAGNTDSSDFPVVDPIQATFHGFDSDAFVAKFNSQGTTLLYSTYLGGTNTAAGLGDYAYGLAVNGSGNAYVTGYTFAEDFPLAGTPFQASNAGNFDAFVAVINDAAGTPGGCTTSCLRVTAIDMRPTAGGVSARVTVKNESNAPVSGASVAVTWNLPGGGTSTQVRNTNLQGGAIFSIAGGPGRYTITVLNITKSGSTFDPQNSTLLSKSITR